MTVIVIVTKINKNNPSKNNKKHNQILRINYKMILKKMINKKSNWIKNK